ncbi:hypothetical protein BDR22DRAFT_520052 [Usnea florida]
MVKIVRRAAPTDQIRERAVGMLYRNGGDGGDGTVLGDTRVKMEGPDDDTKHDVMGQPPSGPSVGKEVQEYAEDKVEDSEKPEGSEKWRDEEIDPKIRRYGQDEPSPLMLPAQADYSRMGWSLFAVGLGFVVILFCGLPTAWAPAQATLQGIPQEIIFFLAATWQATLRWMPQEIIFFLAATWRQAREAWESTWTCQVYPSPPQDDLGAATIADTGDCSKTKEWVAIIVLILLLWWSSKRGNPTAVVPAEPEATEKDESPSPASVAGSGEDSRASPRLAPQQKGAENEGPDGGEEDTASSSLRPENKGKEKAIQASDQQPRSLKVSGTSENDNDDGPDFSPLAPGVGIEESSGNAVDALEKEQGGEGGEREAVREMEEEEELRLKEQRKMATDHYKKHKEWPPGANV